MGLFSGILLWDGVEVRNNLLNLVYVAPSTRCFEYFIGKYFYFSYKRNLSPAFPVPTIHQSMHPQSSSVFYRAEGIVRSDRHSFHPSDRHPLHPSDHHSLIYLRSPGPSSPSPRPPRTPSPFSAAIPFPFSASSAAVEKPSPPQRNAFPNFPAGVLGKIVIWSSR